MMFMNPRHVDVDCYEEEDTEKGKQRRQRSLRQGDGQNGYLQRITLILVCIYLFISVCLALFYYPLSILSVVPFPLIIITITIFAVMNKKVDEITTLWFCAIASGFGAFGKLIAIIVFSSIFGFTRGIEVENRRRGGMQLIPQTQEEKFCDTKVWQQIGSRQIGMYQKNHYLLWIFVYYFNIASFREKTMLSIEHIFVAQPHFLNGDSSTIVGDRESNPHLMAEVEARLSDDYFPKYTTKWTPRKVLDRFSELDFRVISSTTVNDHTIIWTLGREVNKK